MLEEDLDLQVLLLPKSVKGLLGGSQLASISRLDVHFASLEMEAMKAFRSLS